MKFILKTYSILRMNYFFVDFIQENHNFECLGLGFPIAISLHAIARNFAQLFSNCDCELLRVELESSKPYIIYATHKIFN